jgi:uncharacterized protein
MRIVLDTNIYLSNFIFGGLTARVCTVCFEEHTVYISPFIKTEITQKLSVKFAYPTDKIAFVLKTIALVTQEVLPDNPMPDICRDADDNAILQLCAFIKADFLITGDKDLLILNTFGETKIIKPSVFA